MTKLKTLTAIATITFFGFSAFAQENATSEVSDENGEVSEGQVAPSAKEEPKSDLANDADAAFPVDPPQTIEEGREYVKEKHGDWQINCVRQNGLDNCNLYQLLMDQNENPTAEVTMLALPKGSQAAAGVTIATPLGTLLTRQATIRVDSGKARKYPFSWCDRGGCYARYGMTAADISAYKRGNGATVSLVAIAAVDQPLNLNMSLTGFTAGWDALQALSAE